MQSTQVMIVEDERIVALHLKQQLVRLGYAVDGIAASGAQALSTIERQPPDVVLMDIHIDGDMDGIDTAARIDGIPVIYLTAYSEDTTLERARATKPFGYLVKPISERELHATIQMALKRREVEGALRDSRELLSFALDAAEMGSWELDGMGRKINRDGNALRITGVPSEAASTALADFLGEIFPEDRQAVAEEFDRLMSEGAPCEIEFRRTRTDNGIRWLRAHGKAFRSGGREVGRIIGIVQDITEEIERERRQRIMERLETIGTLAGGIAHDVNNMLVPILTLTELVRESLPERDLGRRQLTTVLESGLRIRQLVAQVLAFSRQDAYTAQPLDLHDVMRAALVIARATIPASVTIRDRLERGIGPISAAPVQIDTILINLIVNAAQAIAPAAGAVDVTLEKIEIDPATTKGRGDLPPGSYARIAVADNGSGMDAATLERIFEPFFTTKPLGKGTGLGLSVVFGTVKKLGGAIDVKSEVGVGSIFMIDLPLIAGHGVH
ncbi:ATP-binding response regulator [Shumkonia mesophila]|uniref:ATP-binding response regulator n=1 Tax=Shumkonia mesophila TaxID=2838854 RepID=UPI0029342521|nr:response regulator [Shumkonia mesophila]